MSPKAENGKETMKVAVPKSREASCKGLTAIRSANMVSAPISVTGFMELFAKAEAPNGIIISDTIHNKIIMFLRPEMSNLL